MCGAEYLDARPSDALPYSIRLSLVSRSASSLTDDDRVNFTVIRKAKYESYQDRVFPDISIQREAGPMA